MCRCHVQASAVSLASADVFIALLYIVTVQQVKVMCKRIVMYYDVIASEVYYTA